MYDYEKQKPEIVILAIDAGTTNVRAGLIDEKGHLLALSSMEVSIQSPIPGAAVQSLTELYNAMINACKEVLKKARIEQVDVVSLSAQMHGLAVIDREGRELMPLITYLDTRPASAIKDIIKDIEPYDLYKETGCPPLFIYALPKIVWIKKEKSGVFNEARWFLSVKDYFTFRMYGEPYLDKSVASGSQLFDIRHLGWSHTALEIAGIGEEKLPTLVNGEKEFMEIPSKFARLIGLKEAPIVVLGASDGALHSVGVGAVNPQILALNIGTSGAVRSIAETPIIDKSLKMRFFCYYLGYGLRLPGGAINNAGICLRWFRDEFGHLEISLGKILGRNPYEIICDEAKQIKPTSEGLLVFPFFGGERFPIRDPYARGVIFGLSLRHGRKHIIRSIMESIVYMLRWIYDSMRENGIRGMKLRTGGGGSRSKLWRQIQADVFGLPVELTAIEEASLLGAAVVGAIAIRVYNSLHEAVRNMIRVRDITYPNPEAREKYEKAYELFKNLYNLLKKAFLEYHKFISQN